MEKIINKAIESKASDIHIYPHISGESIIKLRVKGILKECDKYKNSEIVSLISLLKFNSNIDISRNKEPQSGRFVYEYNNQKYYLRVSTLPLNELSEGCVIRIFTNELEEIQYSVIEEDNLLISSLGKYVNGLILFSGPTGSGKSTSLYKLADSIAKENKQVLTIEDPVEKNISSLIQMQVNEKAGINYSNALKSILRCDPDVIVIGEIRDSTTARQVITSSLSGHLVISTIHAEDCIGVINRLLDLGIGKEDIKQTVLCLISQRLINLKDGNRGVITEIIRKSDLNNYFSREKFEYHSMKEKFDIVYRRGDISEVEKKRWGY